MSLGAECIMLLFQHKQNSVLSTDIKSFCKIREGNMKYQDNRKGKVHQDSIQNPNNKLTHGRMEENSA